MKFTAFTAIMVLTVLLFAAPSPALAQGNFSLLFGGTAAGDIEFYKFDTTDTILNDFRARNSVFPRLELRFFQNRHVTLGVSYSKWLLDSPVQRWSELTDENGKELVGTTLAGKTDADVLLTTAYFNPWTKGKIRPFVSVSGGLNRIKSQYRYETLLDPILRGGLNPDDFASDPNSSYDPDTGIISVNGSEQKNRPAFGIASGVNVFPKPNIIISMFGGWLNGGKIFNLAVGITFF